MVVACVPRGSGLVEADKQRMRIHNPRRGILSSQATPPL